jgi:glycosyltransferase involved in cell wall biosynthesis
MRIVFVHSRKAFLPGIHAYTDFFSRYGIECATATPENFQQVKRDVEWFFMGMDRFPRTKDILRIHEYASASLPPFSRQKDLLKRILNQRPDFRIFQNQFIRERMGFSDAIPFGFRTPCLSGCWLEPDPVVEKEFDFIYTGDVSKQRRIEQLLNHFTGPMKEHRLLVVSREFDTLKKKFARAGNILFEGPLPQREVKDRILRSCFAINFIPDIIPFSRQVSTKLLEYAACGVPIITTDYKWVRTLEREQGGKFFYLSEDLKNFSWEEVNAFAYEFPDLKIYTGENQVRESGVLSFLQQHFPGLSFNQVSKEV